jgi:hypothetical protein
LRLVKLSLKDFWMIECLGWYCSLGNRGFQGGAVTSEPIPSQKLFSIPSVEIMRGCRVQRRLWVLASVNLVNIILYQNQWRLYQNHNKTYLRAGNFKDITLEENRRRFSNIRSKCTQCIMVPTWIMRRICNF